MDTQPSTLLDIAIQFLLKNEPAGIQALEKIPQELWVPFFAAAFKGRHKNILAVMVKFWPYNCLHIGALSTRGCQRELLVTIIESFQFQPVHNWTPRSPKLRIIDLREDATSCKIICPQICTNSTACLHSCAYSEHSIMKRESQCSSASLETGVQSSKKAMELIVNLCFDGTLREREFLSLILSKVEKSSGYLHLCCRGLEIDRLSDHRNTTQHLDLKCIDHLSVEQASLSEVNNLLAQIIHVNRLCLTRISCRSLNGRIFQSFTSHLRHMDRLNELNLSSFCLTDHVESVLRDLPTALDYLHLSFCGLSYNDFKFLSECPQTRHLKLLNISYNQLYLEDCGLFYHLLQRISSTIKHLAINHCFLTDSTISVLIPALIPCSQLQVLNFSSNRISMPMLIEIVKFLTPMMQLKYVFYSIPIHCYGRWHYPDSLDRQKLAEVHAQLKQLLQEAQRNDMNWITY